MQTHFAMPFTAIVMLAAALPTPPADASVVVTGFDVWTSGIVKDRVFTNPVADVSVNHQAGTDADGWTFNTETATAVTDTLTTVNTDRGGGTATRFFRHTLQSDVREFQSIRPDRFTHQSSISFSTTLYGSIRHSTHGNFFFVSHAESENKGLFHRDGRFVVDQPIRLSLRLETATSSGMGAAEMLNFFGLQAGSFTFADHLFYFSRSQLAAEGVTSSELTMSRLGVDYTARVFAEAGWLDLEIDLSPTDADVPVEVRYQWRMDPTQRVSISTAVSTTRTVSATYGFTEQFEIAVIPEPSTVVALAVAMGMGLSIRRREV